MTSFEGPPTIAPISWAPAKDVLQHEAHHFTPWLAQNLPLLGDVLGLDSLDLVATEWKVESFALDVLASGTDSDGDVTVVIENQYGTTNHRHLGQLLTYAAHAAAGGHRVLAVWLTERVHPAHLAAVEFVNRVAAEGSTFGIVLVRVRFAPGPEGSWYVHFEVEAEPNAFLSTPVPGPSFHTDGKDGPGSSKKASFISELDQALFPLLQPLGMLRGGNVSTRHGVAKYRLPAQLELSGLATARVVVTADATNVGLYIERLGREENWAVAELLRGNYEPLVSRYGLSVHRWHGSSPSSKRDRVISRIEAGYTKGDSGEVALDAAKVFRAWVEMLSEHPAIDLEQQAVELAEEASAGDAQEGG